ncbi:MAG: energy transducer TonB [Bacteroidota bacterium]
MSDKKKHSTAEQYLQYLKGELSNGERHDFERGMEADPFEKEALEGLENLTPDQALEDILFLHGRLRKRLARRRRITYYSVAASVASLLIIGTVFLQIYDFNPNKRDEMNEQEMPVLSHEKDQAVSSETGDVSPEKERIPGEKVEAVKLEEEGRSTKVEPEIEPAAVPLADNKKKGERNAKGPSVKSEQVAQGPAMQEAREVDNEMVTLADDAELEVSEAAEIAEMAGQKRSKSANDAVSVGYTDKAVSDTVQSQTMAEPSIGYEAFNKYIRDHIRYPDTKTGFSREVVILNFTVTAGGEITDIKPIRSPGEEFTEEAIRLIREGPSWRPATNDLGATEEAVRLRIVFTR